MSTLKFRTRFGSHRMVSLLAVAVGMVLLSTGSATAEAHRSTNSGLLAARSGSDERAVPDDDREFGIFYNRNRKEVIIEGRDYAKLNQGTAIRVLGNKEYPSAWILRVNLVSYSNFDGTIYFAEDFPIYNPDGSANVSSISYGGGNDASRNEFSNYTALPLNATGNGFFNFFLGGSGDDHLSAPSYSDNKMVGGEGNDTLEGMGLLLGGPGNDHLVGGSEEDRLEGGGGDDTLEGKAGDDELLGGDDDDRLYPGRGSDKSYGGNGNDLIEEFAVGPDENNYGPDTNLLCGQDGADELRGTDSGGDTVNHLDSELSDAAGGGNDSFPDILHGYNLDTYDFDPLNTWIFGNGILVLNGEPGFPYPTPTSC